VWLLPPEIVLPISRNFAQARTLFRDFLIIQCLQADSSVAEPMKLAARLDVAQRVRSVAETSTVVLWETFVVKEMPVARPAGNVVARVNYVVLRASCVVQGDNGAMNLGFPSAHEQI